MVNMKQIWKRILANDYAFFIIISLMFAIVESLFDALCFRLGFFTETDGLSFSSLWIVGFFVAFLLHWQNSKNKSKSYQLTQIAPHCRLGDDQLLGGFRACDFAFGL